MQSPQRERLHSALLQVLTAPTIARPIYGTRTVHALCHLLGSPATEPLLELDRFSATLLRAHIQLGRGLPADAMYTELARVLQQYQGILQPGLTTLDALVSLMALPLEPRIPALCALDSHAVALCALEPTKFLAELGALIDRYRNLPQAGMLTLTTLYGVLTMPDASELQTRALQRLEVHACTLVGGLMGEVQRRADEETATEEEGAL
jgi:hypothetical protein